MPQLPDLEEISVEEHLQDTEQVLKRLLINIEAFKRIEKENSNLKRIILDNQQLLKKDFKERLENVSRSLKLKDDLAKKTQEDMIRQFKAFVDKLNQKILREIEKNERMRKKYVGLYNIAEKLYRQNRQIKLILLKNNAVLRGNIEGKFKEIRSSLLEKQQLAKERHTELLKQHEQIKLEFNKKLTEEKTRNVVLEKKYRKMLTASDLLLKDNARLQKINKKILSALSYMEKKSLANEKLLEGRVTMIKKDFEEKLQEVTKLQLDKELEYKTRVDSLTKDLEFYYEELRQSKQKYYQREQEIKEKLKELLA